MDGHVRLRDDDLITRFSIIKWTEQSSLTVPPSPSDIGLTAAEYSKRRLNLAYQAKDFVFPTPDTMFRLIGTHEPIQPYDVDEDCKPVDPMLFGCRSSKKFYRPWYYLPDPFVFLDSDRRIAYYDNRTYYESNRSSTLSGDLIVDESWYTAHVTKNAGTKRTGIIRLFSPDFQLDLEDPKPKDEPETEHERMYRFFFGSSLKK